MWFYGNIFKFEVLIKNFGKYKKFIIIVYLYIFRFVIFLING